MPDYTRTVRNITVCVTPELYRNARRFAADRDETVTALVREVLAGLPSLIGRARCPACGVKAPPQAPPAPQPAPSQPQAAAAPANRPASPQPVRAAVPAKSTAPAARRSASSARKRSAAKARRRAA